MRSGGFLFPAPKKAEKDIVALVVEKKGDETKTSMRQSEIYAYSPKIIIRDGYMVMPKFEWTRFEIGDWFFTEPSYAIDSYKQERERELTVLRKIKSSDYQRLEIPPTRVENGNVLIQCLYVLCPEFIRNKETRNSYGSYKKLYVMNMGQGFVHNSAKEFPKLRPEKIYKGVFEFRAKDNGAVNFAYRACSEIRDHTNHIMERDAMWELIRGATEVTDVDQKKEMKEALENLYKDAEEFDNDLEMMGLYGLPLDKSKKDDTILDVTLTPSRLSNSESTSGPPPQSFSTEASVFEMSMISQLSQQLYLNADTSMMFYSKEKRDAHRQKTIKKYIEGSTKEMWVDNETGERSIDDDILIFKFDHRHPLVEAQDTPDVTQQPTRAQTSTRPRTFSESSSRLVENPHPLASSTPRPSPEPRRRSHTVIRTDEEEELDVEEAEENGREEPDSHYMNQTSNTTIMRRDNNANPICEQYLYSFRP